MLKDNAPRLITIDEFVKGMLGHKSSSSYYNHMHEEGYPQRVWPSGKPMLVYSECVAYLETLMQRRVKPPKFEKPPPRNPGQRGRPRKQPAEAQ